MALVAPSSVHWEVGNALAAMLRRRRAHLADVPIAPAAYEMIAICFVDVQLAETLSIADQHGLSAYGALLIACARRQHCPLLTLDQGLARTARTTGVEVMEVEL